MKITALHLHAADIAAQRAFYAGALGFPLLEETPAAFMIQAGATRLRFVRADRIVPAYHLAFAAPPGRVAAARAWLADHAALLALDGRDRFEFSDWDATAVYARDPAGNVIECIARRAGSATAAGFDAHQVLGVCEIGLPVDDVPTRARELTAALGVAPYRGQGAAFAPLGDEQGLLIVVQAGRPWFPTAIPALPGPIELTIVGERPGRHTPSGMPYTIIVATA